MWQSTIRKLKRDDVRVITLDLIGFGQSPKPRWARYSAKFQAASLRLTLAKMFVTGKVVIIGHSLGALVAIEAQKRYPYVAKALILCSPPLYVAPNEPGLMRPERMLRRLFLSLESNSNQLVSVSTLATKYKVVVNKSFNVTSKNVDIFFNTLNAAITNQTAMKDILTLRVPVHIIHGIVDPLVIASNLRAVAKQNNNITVTDIPAGHEVVGAYNISLVSTINKVVDRL